MHLVHATRIKGELRPHASNPEPWAHRNLRSYHPWTRRGLATDRPLRGGHDGSLTRRYNHILGTHACACICRECSYTTSCKNNRHQILSKVARPNAKPGLGRASPTSCASRRLAWVRLPLLELKDLAVVSKHFKTRKPIWNPLECRTWLRFSPFPTTVEENHYH